MANLASLLAQSRQLNSHLDTQELPAINLGLEQVEEVSRKLARSNAGFRGMEGVEGTSRGESRAAHLLATGNINLADLQTRVELATSPNAIGATFEPLVPLGDSDVDGFLRHNHEQTLLSTLEESRSNVLSTFYATLDARMQQSWEAQKLKILEEIGAGGGLIEQQQAASASTSKGGLSSSWGSKSLSGSGLGKSTVGGVGGKVDIDFRRGGEPLPGQTLANHQRMMKYDSIIKHLNKSRKQRQPIALLGLYQQVLSAPPSMASSSSTSSSPPPMLLESLNLVSYIVSEKNSSTTVPLERSFASSYLPTASPALKKSIAKGGREFLEAQFEVFIEKRLAQNPVLARLGGVPSLANKIRGYARVVLGSGREQEISWREDLEILNGQPVYAQIYYLLRAGHTREALEMAIENEAAFKDHDKYIVQYLRHWIEGDRLLPSHQRGPVQSDYNQRLRFTADLPTSDPFKIALYRIVGRIDVKKTVTVAKTTEDWLWVQLNFVKEEDDMSSSSGLSNGGDKFGLNELTQTVMRFGERYFDPKGDRPLFWFQVLLFVGQFERAVDFLYHKSQYQIDAVQFAIALSYYGLLRVPSSSKSSDVELLSVQADDLTATFNFAKMIQRYIKLFSTASPQEALQYIYLICLPATKDQISICHATILDLVLSSRKYTDLLGDLKTNGTKIPGAIEKDLPLIHLSAGGDGGANFLNEIVKVAAKRSLEDGGAQRMSDSIILYNLAEDYNAVVSVLNRALGNSLAQPSPWNGSPDGAGVSVGFGGEQDIENLATGILEHYHSEASKWRKITEVNRETCRVLLALKHAFRLYADATPDSLDKCLELIESIGLLPLTADIQAIHRRADEFKELDESISKNFQTVLIITMNCLFKLNQILKSSAFGGEARQNKMSEYKKKARSLMMFAGMLRYRLSSEVYQQLTRLDAFLN